jgi:solute carrier family 25 carnitine/acylcarnitine transporter 20/29
MSEQTLKELFAGSVGGIVQVLVGQPFDTIKVRLQTQSVSNPVYTGVLDCARKTLATEGASAFYKGHLLIQGTLTPLLGIGACVSIQFGALEALKRMMGGKDLSFAQLYLAGAGSGFANSFLCGPIEHVRIRLQLQTAKNRLFAGPLDFLKKTYTVHGIAGVFKGQGITFLRETHGFGVYFAVYEYLIQKTMEREKIARSQISTYKQLLYGALSGYALWIFIYPIVTISNSGRYQI